MAAHKEARAANKPRVYIIRMSIANDGSGDPARSLTALPPKFRSTRTDKIKFDNGKTQTGN